MNEVSGRAGVKRIAVIVGAGAAIALGVLGFADRPATESPAEFVPVAQGDSTTTTVLPSVNYVPSATAPVKASFFGKS